jgi:hypothetical protein
VGQRELKACLAMRDRLYDDMKLAKTRKNAAAFRRACEAVAATGEVTLERLKAAFSQTASAN